MSDESRVKELLHRYFEAVSASDIETLKTIFHPDSSIFGYLGNDLVLGTPQIFYDDLASKPSMKESHIDCICKIEEIHVVGKTASARIYVTNFFGLCDVVDQFHLIQINNEWRIFCKTFTTC